MISYFTFQDAIDHGLDYLGGNPSDNAHRDCVRAALEAYRDLANAYNWSYLYTQSRIFTNGAFDGTQNNATIQYQQSSGTYPYQCTLTGATWPSWANLGVIRVGQVGYVVNQVISPTVLTFDPLLNPGVDLAAGTAFQLYQDTYLLPEDFIAQDQSLYERNFGGMEYTHPREWLFENRYVFAQGIPQYFTITGSQKYPGRLVARIYPWPAESKTIDFIYKRRPRALLTLLVTTGTVSVTLNSNVVTGTGTTFTPQMVGSVIRFSGNSVAPSSLIMNTNPKVFESVIMAYVSPTSVTIQDPLNATYTNVAYTVSDTIDIEAGAMLNAYLRCIEKHLGMSRTLKDKPSAAKQYDLALSEAKSADSRSFQGKSVSQKGPLRRRLRDYPIDLSDAAGMWPNA